MAWGVSFTEPWRTISADDYMEEMTEDGAPFRAIANVQDLATGRTEYWGILEDED